MSEELDFVDWLQGELNKREWRQATLVRKGNINSGLLGQIMNRQRKPGPSTLMKIADALSIPREFVFTKWGYLQEHGTEQEKMLQQIQFNASGLSLAQLFELNHYAVFLSQNKEGESDHEDA